jgi:hypothetical protein
MKKLWESISDRHKRLYKDLSNLIFPFSNYKTYREEIKRRHKEGLPVLPYFGLFLKDLATVTENVPLYDETNEINMELIELVFLIFYNSHS